tara:strand:- start:219 stop:482 length:264 start_codon:yes stop_codon:yes gene_type:complete
MTTKELMAKIDDMPKLNTDALNQRASDKAFAKLFHLNEELEKLKEAIIDPDSKRNVSSEVLEKCINATINQIDTWNYIAKLVETDTN